MQGRIQVYGLCRGVFRYMVYAGAYSGIWSGANSGIWSTHCAYSGIWFMQGRIQVYGLSRGVFRYMVYAGVYLGIFPKGASFFFLSRGEGRAQHPLKTIYFIFQEVWKHENYYTIRDKSIITDVHLVR